MTANENHQELEVKFYLCDLQGVETRLLALEAQLAQPRIYEINLRFDTPKNELSLSNQVLRLRKDSESRITYKGPIETLEGVRVREELEFTVSDFNTAQALLEALGYRVAVMYEKYRAAYRLGDALITLDEMPYGLFVEIEGPDSATIQSAAEQLGLDWNKRILDSYMMLFQRLRQKMGFNFRDLSFENFAALTISADDLGVMQVIGN
jgi:adenylate cyclase class 2